MKLDEMNFEERAIRTWKIYDVLKNECPTLSHHNMVWCAERLLEQQIQNE